MARPYKDPTADKAIGNVMAEERKVQHRLERDIVADILAFLRDQPNIFCWKEHGDMYSTGGIPDIICCIQGRFVAFEVKTLTGKASGLQKATIRKIQAAGGTACIVRSVYEVQDVLEVLMEES